MYLYLKFKSSARALVKLSLQGREEKSQIGYFFKIKKKL